VRRVGGGREPYTFRTFTAPDTQCERRAGDAAAQLPNVRVLGPVQPGLTVLLEVSGFPPGAGLRVRFGVRADPQPNWGITPPDPVRTQPGYPVGPTGARVLDVRVPRAYLRCVTLACDRAGDNAPRMWRAGEPAYVYVSTADDMFVRTDDDVSVKTETRIADPAETRRAEISFAADSATAPASSFAWPLSVVSLFDAGDTAARTVRSAFDTWKVPLDPRSKLPVVSGHEPPQFQPPVNDVVDCMSESGVRTPEGRTHNRFTWCQYESFELIVIGQPPGRATLIARSIAYGRDDGRRSVRVFLRVEDATWSGKGVTGLTSVSLGPQCSLPAATDYVACGVEGVLVTRTLSQWKAAKDWLRWDIVSDPSLLPDDVLFKDKVLKHKWNWDLASPSFRREKPPAQRTIRCDSATYFRYGKRAAPAACVFDDVIPHLRWSLLDERISEAVDHINSALNRPNDTLPEVAGGVKDIPGKYTGRRDGKGLHRLPPRDPQRRANRQRATGH
jgi:hypothetical protein